MSSAGTERQLAFRALADCCRIWLGTRTTNALEEQHLDWESFGKLAFIHSLEPLLHSLRATDRLPRSDVPASLTGTWETAYYENFVFNQEALGHLAALTGICGEREIPTAAIKGPVAIARLYGDPALRVFADLDLLCHRHDLQTVEELAGDLGFANREQTAVYHTTLRHRESGLLLELHTDLYDFLPASKQAHEHLLESARPLECGDLHFPALPVPLEAAVGVAHLINHDLEVSLKPLLDLAATLLDRKHEHVLREILAAWDLQPEYRVIRQVIARLFGCDFAKSQATLSSNEVSMAEQALATVATVEQTSGRQALEELAARSGIAARSAYLKRLLLPDSLPPGAGKAISGAQNLLDLARRGWTKLRRGGLARSVGLSLKRQVYARRRQR